MSEETSEVKRDQEEQIGIGQAVRKGLAEAVEPFQSLVDTPKALWGIYISYAIEGLVYFGILTILGKYLSENVGLSDQHAGFVYSFFTGGITLAMLFLGGQADRLGVRLALYISVGLMVVGRFFLAASGSFFPQGQGMGSVMFLFVALGLFVVVLGYGMYQPAAYAAVKQFAGSKAAATMGYAMIYGLMNLGAFFSGILSPPVRQNFGIEAVFWVYAVLTVLSLVVLLKLLTRQSVAEGTRTDISQDSEAEGKEGAEGPGAEEGGEGQAGDSSEQDAGPRDQRPLWTWDFSLLVAAAAGVAVWIGVLVFTSPMTPAQKAFERAAKVFKETRPGKAKGLEERLTKAARRLEELVPQVQPPEDPDARPNPNIYRNLRRWLQLQAGGLRQLSKTPVLFLDEPPEPPKKRAEEAGDEVRAAGLWVLAAAYSMVSKVDRHVVEKLRRSMRLKSEKRVPLSSEDEALLLKTVGKRASWERLAGVAGRLSKAAVFADRAGPSGRTAAALLRISARSYDSLVADLRRQADPQLEKLAKDLLLEEAKFLLKELGPALRRRAAPRKLLGAYLTQRKHLADILADWAVQGDNVPWRAKARKWGRRYGVPVGMEVLLVVLILVLLLKRRPDHPFRDGRFVYFIFILIPVQTLFAHNWLTLPYYINRAFAGSWVGDYFELFSNINPLLIFVLTPVVAALTARYRVYKMMIAGTFVMAVPTFLLAVGPNPFLLLLYIFLMSVGEAMWQPRFLQWVAEIAPKGKAGAYMGIAQFPWFLTKVVTGFYSGWFLAHYCPAIGPQNTEFLWFVYGLIAMVSPVALLLAKGWMLRGEKL